MKRQVIRMISMIKSVRKIVSRFCIFIAISSLASCKMYKQDVMFKLDQNFTESDLSEAVITAESNYVVQVNDKLRLDVFTNDGERIVDPNFELAQQGNRMNGQQRREYEYLVMIDSTAKFPKIGQIKVVGLTINEAESLLQELYNEYYRDSFVKLSYNNKRVIVLGALGGQIIPLENENLSLVEIIALSGGINQGGKAQNVKLIRGALDDPQVFQIDLGTVDGMRNSILKVQPGDLIYIEPWRRPVLEGIRDLAPIFSFISSTLALALVITSISNN